MLIFAGLPVFLLEVVNENKQQKTCKFVKQTYPKTTLLACPFFFWRWHTKQKKQINKRANRLNQQNQNIHEHRYMIKSPHSRKCVQAFLYPSWERGKYLRTKILIMANLVSDSGASRMDYSARGDFPSIAVSIKRPPTTIHYPLSTIHQLPTIHNIKIHNPQSTTHITLKKPPFL